jgi:hypothetical protein
MEVDEIHTDQILRVSTPPPINALRKKPTRYLRALVLLLASFITVGPYARRWWCWVVIVIGWGGEGRMSACMEKERRGRWWGLNFLGGVMFGD